MTGSGTKDIKGRSFALALSAVIAISGTASLTGCGKGGAGSTSAPTALEENTAADATAELAETTEAASESAASETATAAVTSKPDTTEAATEAVSTDTATEAAAVDDSTAGNDGSDDVGIDEATAIGNVRLQVGSGAEILSCTKGHSPDGLRCWVITVAPITNGTGPDTVTYYSGYQFCYPEATTAADSGQNPMMNFIGNYTNGRATMLVSCLGMDKASFRITWSGSATDSAVWTMSGDVVNTGESLEVAYDNCTKQTFSYSSSGELLSNDTGYTDGSGKMVFLFSDNRAYWYDDEEDAGADTSFWYYNDTE